MYNVQSSSMKGDSKFTRRELFPMKRSFIDSFSVGSTQFVSNYSFLQEDLCTRFDQGPLDLRLSIGNSCDYGHLDDNEVNLSLSIGMNNYKRSRISKKSSKNTIVMNSNIQIIDLEDSTDTESNEFSTNVMISNQGSSSQRDVKQTILMDIDLNKDQHDEFSYESNKSCSQITNSPSQTPTSKQPKSQTSSKESQTKIYSIDLESLPESDITEEDISDNTIHQAAVSLVSISLVSNFVTGSNEIEKVKENKKWVPCSSIDSYESLVLKLEESSVDEDSATSKVFEFNEFDRKENGIKLRRGRRLKNFQKDVLPIMSSLSKDEIWEDIKIFESAIRSREYKRLNKVKICKAENLSTVVKSKRLKVSYISPKRKR